MKVIVNMDKTYEYKDKSVENIEKANEQYNEEHSSSWGGRIIDVLKHVFDVVNQHGELINIREKSKITDTMYIFQQYYFAMNRSIREDTWNKVIENRHRIK